MQPKPRIAFVCTHNACRSQMAEALATHLGGDIAVFLSAGTEIADKVDPLAVEAVRDLYGVVIDESYHPKIIEDILPVDMVVTMGCGVSCPVVPEKQAQFSSSGAGQLTAQQDWGLDDPSGGDIKKFEAVAREIHGRVVDLIARIEQGEFA